MEQTANSFLETERLGRLMAKYTVPCVFSLIISCLYNIVDQIFVGNGVGYLGNAATGVIFPITVIGWGVSLFFGDSAAGTQGAAALDPELYLSTSAVQQAVIAQEKAINLIADMGSCVIVGRAADYVLRNRENVVRIIIHAPQEYRVKKVMEMYGDTEQEGRKSIAHSDSARSSYYKSISGHTWGDPHQYELSVDSSIRPEKTADLICGYVSHTLCDAAFTLDV